MSIVFYGDSISGNCLKGKWVAQLLNIPFEWRETSVVDKQTRTPEFLAINPAGQVPVALLEDGRILAQSNAIMLYLAEGSPLIPENAYDRGKMFEWLFWEQYSHEPNIASRRFIVTYLKQEPPAHMLPKGEAALARMQVQLKDTPYLVGNALTLADIALVAYTRVAHEGGFDLAQYPSVAAWVARVERDLGLQPAKAA